MIDLDLDEQKKREDDPVARAESDELMPAPDKVDQAAEQQLDAPEHAPTPDDQHVEVDAESLAKMAGISPAPAPAAQAQHAEPAHAPAHAPAHEDEQEDAAPLEFGPPMPTEHDRREDAEPQKAPVDGKAALTAAAGAAAHVAHTAHEEHAAVGADGFAGTAEVKGKQKWNESAYYKHDNTTGFDVGGKRQVALGKNASGEVDAADAAVYATAAVETSGTYDAVQTYDKGILSFGIMQWTLHQGSLMKFLDYLKSQCGADGKAAFHEHFTPLGIDVAGESLVVGGATIHPDAAGRKQLDKLVRADKDTTRRWVVAFHQAGQDERVARAQWVYTKKQYTETAGKTLEKYVAFARKKGYSAKHSGQYHTPSFWCRDPDAAALFFSMTANNPGYSYYGVIKSADVFMDAHGTDPSKWPDGWAREFTGIYATLLPMIIASWKGRVAKTLEHLHLAKDGKSPQASAPAPRAHEEHHAATPAATHAPAPEAHHGLTWLADVMTRKVVRGLEDASTAARHFLGFASTGTPHHDEAKHPVPAPAKALAHKIEAAAPAHAAVSKGGKGKQGSVIPSAKLHAEGGKGKKHYKLDEGQYAFKQKVYEASVNGNIARGQIMFSGLGKDELTEVDGKLIKNDVAPHLSQMMSELRAAWREAKAGGDDKAARVSKIGLTSGYRDPEHDFSLWDDYFYQYYAATAALREKTGDPHGAESQKLLVKFIHGKKAPPGFSNHTGGTAVDMSAVVDGDDLGADFSKQKAWYDSWVWHWLHTNAHRFGFQPIKTEAWHWEFHGV